MIRIKRGLNIPISGSPRQFIDDAPAARAVALLGIDYIGMKPTMAVREGDRVRLGQLLFSDKKTEGVCYTSPASGVVAAPPSPGRSCSTARLMLAIRLRPGPSSGLARL